MRFAVLDLGTNTFHLLVADADSRGSFQTVFRSRRTVKLGRQGLKRIGDQPFQRGVSVLEDYADILYRLNADVVKACATSALRSAVNGNEFVDTVRRSTGIRIEVITGSREAELICRGVRACVEATNGYDLIMDIGGGSTEFIIAGPSKIAWKRSFNTGAARLLETAHLSNPARPAEIRRLEEYLLEAWQPLEHTMKRYPATRLIGSSGSFESFANMIAFREGLPVPRARRHLFNLPAYERLHKNLVTSTASQRANMRGLVKMRVDMIVPASVSAHFILKKYRFREMILSKFAMKEGMLSELIDRENARKRI